MQAINLKLVESLIQAIDALPPAEQSLLRARLLQSSTPRQSAIELLNTPSQPMFQSPEEVDQYIQQERASWDS
jgi:hypothetical protein